MRPTTGLGSLSGEPFKGNSRPLAASRQRDRARSISFTMINNLSEHATSELPPTNQTRFDRRIGQSLVSPTAMLWAYLTELSISSLNDSRSWVRSVVGPGQIFTPQRRQYGHQTVKS